VLANEHGQVRCSGSPRWLLCFFGRIEQRHERPRSTPSRRCALTSERWSSASRFTGKLWLPRIEILDPNPNFDVGPQRRHFSMLEPRVDARRLPQIANETVRVPDGKSSTSIDCGMPSSHGVTGADSGLTLVRGGRAFQVPPLHVL